MTDNQTAGSTDNAGSGDGAAQEDVSGLKSALEKERDARKTAEKSLTDLQKRIDDLENKDKTELQRLVDERDRLKSESETRETQLRGMAVTTALTTAATKAGARYPELIVQRVAGDAELDADLNVKNADRLMADAKKTYPDLFRVVEGGADGGKGRNDGTHGGANDMNRLLRQKAGYAG